MLFRSPVLHESKTAVVFKVTKFNARATSFNQDDEYSDEDEHSGDEDNEKAGEVGVPTALKCMRDLDQVRIVLPFEVCLRIFVSEKTVILHKKLQQFH